jgi:hypothetical protein
VEGEYRVDSDLGGRHAHRADASRSEGIETTLGRVSQQKYDSRQASYARYHHGQDSCEVSRILLYCMRFRTGWVHSSSWATAWCTRPRDM